MEFLFVSLVWDHIELLSGCEGLWGIRKRRFRPVGSLELSRTNINCAYRYSSGAEKVSSELSHR